MLNGGLITAVEEVTEGGKSGCKLTIQSPDGEGFKIDDYTIWNGESIVGPSLGVVKDGNNGRYYWTLGDEPLEDADGNKVYTSGIAPRLAVEDGVFKISYDNGGSWNDLGVFSGTVTTGSNIQVEKDGEEVVIKQDKKDDIRIPLTPKTTLGIEFTNITATSGLSIMQNSVYVVKYELKNASENATVKVEMLNCTNFEVENVPGENKFKVTAKNQDVSDVVLVHVYDSLVCMHTSFNITPTTAITEPEVLLSLGEDEVTYTVDLALPEAITRTIAIASLGSLPSRAVTVPSTVEVTNGQGSFDVIINRPTLPAGKAYTFQLVFSEENTDYQVLGSVTMIAGELKKVTLTGDAYYVSNIHGGGGKQGWPELCDGSSSTHWESAWSSSSELYGDETYGVYVDIELPLDAVVVKYKYTTRVAGGDCVPREFALGAKNKEGKWELIGTSKSREGLDKNQEDETSLYSMSDKAAFQKVRFGVTVAGHAGAGLANEKNQGIMTGYLGGNNATSNFTNCVALSELDVYVLEY